VPFPSELPFTSFLQYSPRGTSVTSRASAVLTRAVKDDSFYNIRGKYERAIAYSAFRLAQEISKHKVLADCFSGQVILVPGPKRAPLVPGGSWPTNRLCQEMQKQRIAPQVFPLLQRIKAVQKSATAASGQRPGPQEHYDSLAVDPNRPLLGSQHHLVIVDDVVTRGATFLGCYARLREAYPEVRISCFALIRTMSGVEIDAILFPVSGVITFQNLHLHREP
jgi:hypothetical protein